MNGQEMVYEFQQLLTTINPAFETKERLQTHEILEYINRAVKRYVEEKYLSYKSFKERTYILQTNIDELGDLLTNFYTGIAPVPASLPYINNGYEIGLPDDYWAYIRSDSQVTRVSLFPTSSTWTPNIEIDYSEIRQLSTNLGNHPILLHPVVTIKKSPTEDINPSMIIIVDMFTSDPDNVQVTYLKKPTDITFSTDSYCQLGEQLHQEIIKYALNLFLGEKFRLTNKNSNE